MTKAINNGFKDLTVWQRSRDLAVHIYQLTHQDPFKKDYSLRDQVRRSAVSIPSNLAEGDERESDKEAVRFFFIAKGSLAELRTQMDIAFRIGYISEKTFKTFEKGAIEIGKMIGALIKYRSK